MLQAVFLRQAMYLSKNSGKNLKIYKWKKPVITLAYIQSLAGERDSYSKLELAWVAVLRVSDIILAPNYAPWLSMLDSFNVIGW